MRRRTPLTVLLALVPLLLALVLVGCGQPGAATVAVDRPAPASPAGPSLRDLHDLGELQATFNQDAGRPRLIMLVSPT